MPIIFTKNLYIKEEVECALLSAILMNQKETAVFWGLELFYSGYEEEVFDYLWIVYYDFHASLNPSFEKYFIRKWSDHTMQPEHKLVTIITNLCAKPYTTDVYSLKGCAKENIDTDVPFRTWLGTGDYERIAGYIMGDGFDTSEENMDAVREVVLSHYGIKWYRAMLLPSPRICLKNRFLSHVMQICTDRFYTIPKKYKMNVSCKRIEVPPVSGNGSVARHILKSACKYGINCSDTLHLYRLTRRVDNIDIKKCYREDWLYYSSQTPYWCEKIKEYGGLVDDDKKTVVFAELDSFADKYWLEPDEQSSEVQERCVGEILKYEEGGFRRRFGGWDIAKIVS